MLYLALVGDGSHCNQLYFRLPKPSARLRSPIFKTMLKFLKSLERHPQSSLDRQSYAIKIKETSDTSTRTTDII